MIAGQSPRLTWRENPAGEKRTIEEAKELARKWVPIPEDVDFFADEDNDLPDDMTARGPRVTKLAGSMIYWSDLVNSLTGKVPFLVRPDILLAILAQGTQAIFTTRHGIMRMIWSSE